MRVLHPIRTFRSMRRRSKIIAGSVTGLVLIPAVAIAAVLLSSAAPFSGTVHNGQWSIALSTNTGANSLVADASGDGVADTWFLPSDTPSSVITAVGAGGAGTAYGMPLDTDSHYACSGVTTDAGTASDPVASFTIQDGSGALPGDTCYLNLTYTVPKNAAATWVKGLDVTGLPTGWVALIDGSQGGGAKSWCGASASGSSFLPAGAAGSQTLRLMIVAGANENMTDTAAHTISGHVQFEGNRSTPTDITSADCFVVGS